MDMNVRNTFSQSRPPKTETLARMSNDFNGTLKNTFTRFEDTQTGCHQQKPGTSFDADTRVIAAVAGSLYKNVPPKDLSAQSHQQPYIGGQTRPTLSTLNSSHGENRENSNFGRPDGQIQNLPLRPVQPWHINLREKQTTSALSQSHASPLLLQNQREAQLGSKEKNVNPRCIYTWKKNDNPVSTPPIDKKITTSSISMRPLTVDVSISETPRRSYKEKTSPFNRTEQKHTRKSNGSTNSSNISSSNSESPLSDLVCIMSGSTSLSSPYSPSSMSKSSMSSPAHTPVSRTTAISSMYATRDSVPDNKGCTCQRSPKLILCKSCGEMVEGRVRQMCSVHPKQIFLMDLLCCSNCKSQNLKEICSAKPSPRGSPAASDEEKPSLN